MTADKMRIPVWMLQKACALEVGTFMVLTSAGGNRLRFSKLKVVGCDGETREVVDIENPDPD